MFEEKKAIELKDEDLEKVSGGIALNANGDYVLIKGDCYRENAKFGSSASYIVLESKTTKNVNETINVHKNEATPTNYYSYDTCVTISFLNTLEYMYNVESN